MQEKLEKILDSSIQSTVYRLDSKTLALLDLIPSWLAWAEIECTVHVGLLKGRHKLILNSSSKQTTGARYSLSKYIYCVFRVRHCIHITYETFSKIPTTHCL